jgi:L-fuconolactonase
VRIVDAQLHEIGPWADWTGASHESQHRVLTEVMIAYIDAVGVDGAIIFPGGDDATAAWAAETLPDRFAFVPPISPETPDLERVVAEAKQRKGLVGLRALIGWPLDGSEAKRLEAGAWNPVFAACETHRVPVFLFITGWLSQAAAIAERFPDLPLIVDHLGLRQPPLDTPETPPFRSLPDLLALARFANVYVKLCGLPALSTQPYPYADVAPQLRAICDAFGANRLMWASDTSRFVGRIGIGRYQNPVTLGDYPGKHRYADAYHFTRDSAVLTQAEKGEILGGTVCRVLGWPSRA